MEPVLKDLTARVLALPVDDRAVLAQRLWQSVEGFADPGVEKKWLDLAEQRWMEIEEGRVECIPAEEAMMKVRGTLDKAISLME